MTPLLWCIRCATVARFWLLLNFWLFWRGLGYLAAQPWLCWETKETWNMPGMLFFQVSMIIFMEVLVGKTDKFSLFNYRVNINEISINQQLLARSYLWYLLICNSLSRPRFSHRVVKAEEGQELSLRFGCQFYEVSAAESCAGAALAFHALLREARALALLLPPRRKLAAYSVSKVLLHVSTLKMIISLII